MIKSELKTNTFLGTHLRMWNDKLQQKMIAFSSYKAANSGKKNWSKNSFYSAAKKQ